MSSFKIFTDSVTQITKIIEKPVEEPYKITERTLKAFAISSRSSSDKILTNPNIKDSIDRRLYEYKGELYYPWLFSKTLKHNEIGLTSKEDLDKLINVSKTYGSKDAIDALASAQDPNKVRTLEGVATGQSFIIRGCDTQFCDVSDQFLKADSLENIAEMIEVYEKSLLRDVSFFDYENNNSDVIRAIKSMNNYNNISAYTGPLTDSRIIDGKVLFRGNSTDELYGPYISQFLILPFKYNGINIEQQYPVENDVKNTTEYNTYLDIQRGKITGSPNFSGEYKYIYSGRVLGSVVHNDPMYYAYYNAALISLQNGLKLEYNGTSVTSAWTDQGPPDCLASIAEVALAALRVAWNSKYNIGLKLRPEVMAYRIDQIYNDVLTGSDFEQIKNYLSYGKETLDEVFNKNTNSNYLLTLMYPEGSPAHPSWTAGHAVLAGACITILKAFFKTHDEDFNPLSWPNTPKHSIDGISLHEYNRSDKNRLTIVGEFNKLASNMSLGRDFGGVHYRLDGVSGITLGENFAIKYLQTKLLEYISTDNKMIKSFNLEKINGDYISITVDDIVVLKSRK